MIAQMTTTQPAPLRKARAWTQATLERRAVERIQRALAKLDEAERRLRGAAARAAAAQQRWDAAYRTFRAAVAAGADLDTLERLLHEGLPWEEAAQARWDAEWRRQDWVGALRHLHNTLAAVGAQWPAWQVEARVQMQRVADRERADADRWDLIERGQW